MAPTDDNAIQGDDAEVTADVIVEDVIVKDDQGDDQHDTSLQEVDAAATATAPIAVTISVEEAAAAQEAALEGDGPKGNEDKDDEEESAAAVGAAADEAVEEREFRKGKDEAEEKMEMPSEHILYPG